MNTFIKIDELKERLKDENIKVIDCRFDLFNPEYGEKAYTENHIQGAFFLDVNKDICGEKQEHGGARPIPHTGVFAGKLEVMGISDSTTIVLYDDNIYGSARAFWQMKYMGMEDIHILEGGWNGWVSEGVACSSEVPKAASLGKISIKMDESIYCDMDYVSHCKNKKGTAIIDGRAHERFTGEYEPLYAKAGHIPSALSFPCSQNMEAECSLKDKKTLAKLYESLDGLDEIISYCGSGIAGARNFVVLRELGMPVRLYVGSLSDWIGYEENCIETGEERQ
ncbi:MAG: sulfurtransferase [Peptostreptococcaceae bacterium]|nr:sulfurtransferase [Peptostreptococcaceae bacterium]